MAQLKILTKIEVDKVVSPPVYTQEEKKIYFSLTEDVSKLTSAMRSDIKRVGYILQYGYFQKNMQFYPPKEFRSTDINFVKKMLGIKGEIDLEGYSYNTRLRHKNHILESHACIGFGPNEKKLLQEYSDYITKTSLNPMTLYREMNRYISEKRIEYPSYWMLVDLISNSINSRELALSQVIEANFPKEGERIISELLKDDNITNLDSQIKKNYRLSFFKTINKDLKPALVAESVEKIRILKIYNMVFKDLYKSLDIKFDGMKYFSDYVLRCKVSQLKQMSDPKRKLYLISFIYVTYYYLNDLVSDRLLREVQMNKNSIDIKYEKLRASERESEAKNTNSVLGGIKDIIFPFQLQVLAILASDNITPVEKVNLALKAYHDRSESMKRTELEINEQYDKTIEIIEKIDKFKITEKESVKLQKRTTPIILNLDFEYKGTDQLLVSAIRYYKNNNGLIDKGAPQGFIKTKIRDLLYRENGTFRHSLYKSMLIHQIGMSIKAGSLNVLYSRKYRTFEQFLISENELNQNSKKCLKMAGMEYLIDQQTHINTEVGSLAKQFLITNENINKGNNKHISFKDDHSFVIKTDLVEKDEHHKVSSLVPIKYNINITELLNSVNSESTFTDSFVHFSNKYLQTKPSSEAIIATTIALGCGIGLGKMQQISHNMNEDLNHIATLNCSIENLRRANNEVLKTIDKLPLSKIYDTDSGVHTSSDGANFGVARSSLDCSPTYKTNGTGRGVSVYVFTDNAHKMFYSTVFNSNEKEAHFVIDGLMENDVVQSEIHSTDTAGYSEVIFATTHLLGYKFAPRIKNLKRQVLYSVGGVKEYSNTDYKLKPRGKINLELIHKYWDMILRFIATIKLKRSSASDLFRRLNSYSTDSPFYKALKEYGRIIKTRYILEYLNDHPFRQRIEKQLNKVESIQRFSRAVLATGKYDFSSNIREEQLLMEGAKRLIQNSILCWNYMYLSKLITQAKSYRDKARILKIIKNGSPIFWKHINFFGNYDFGHESIKCQMIFNIRDLQKVKI